MLGPLIWIGGFAVFADVGDWDVSMVNSVTMLLSIWRRGEVGNFANLCGGGCFHGQLRDHASVDRAARVGIAGARSVASVKFPSLSGLGAAFVVVVIDYSDFALEAVGAGDWSVVGQMSPWAKFLFKFGGTFGA
jgi:hypothetical protein